MVTEMTAIGIRIPDVKGVVLDVGGGPGHYSSIFFEASHRIVVDPLYHKFGVKIDGVAGVTCAGEQLPLRSGSVDLIILRNVIDHMLQPEALLKEAARVLKPDGVIYFMVNTFLQCLKPFFPVFHFLDRPHPLHFTVNQIRSMLSKEGFCISRERIAASSHFEWQMKRVAGLLIKREYYALLSKSNQMPSTLE